MVSTNTTSSGIWNLAVLPTKKASSSSRLTSMPGFLTTAMMGRSSHLGWRMPTQAAIATAGCAMAMFSTSIELIHSPPDLITSLLRSVICKKPSASIVATSPVGNQPPSTSGEPPSCLKYWSMIHGPLTSKSPEVLPSHGSSSPLSGLTIFMSTPKIARPCFRRILVFSPAGKSTWAFFSVQTVPSGDISVMPQACNTSTL